MRNEHEASALKKKLMAVFLLEASKNYKEMDDALIAECVGFLMDTEEEKILTQKEIEKIIKKIPFIKNINDNLQKKKAKIKLKTIGIIAAVLAVIFSLFAIASIASGDESDVLFNRFINAISEMVEGDVLRDGSVTFTNATEHRSYSSIEELLEKEELDILYPSWLPNGKKILSVNYAKDGYTGEREYIFITDDVTYNMSVNLDRKTSDEIKTNCDMKIINEIEVYYMYYEDTVFWQANFEYKGMSYRICAYKEEELLKIIENLKEIE